MFTKSLDDADEGSLRRFYCGVKDEEVKLESFGNWFLARRTIKSYISFVP